MAQRKYTYEIQYNDQKKWHFKDAGKKTSLSYLDWIIVKIDSQTFQSGAEFTYISKIAIYPNKVDENGKDAPNKAQPPTAKLTTSHSLQGDSAFQGLYDIGLDRP